MQSLYSGWKGVKIGPEDRSYMMDNVAKFEIVLDLTDCEVIYDYASKVKLYRPAAGTWDPLMFKGRGTLDDIPVNDEKEKTRIIMMDQCFTDMHLLEKAKSKDKDKKDGGKQQAAEGIAKGGNGASSKGAEWGSREDFIFEEDEYQGLPRRLLPIYHPGDKVKGHLVMQLKQAIQAESLRLQFDGKTKVNIRIHHQYGYTDDTQYEKFVEESRHLWQRINPKRSEGSDKYTLLSSSESPEAEGEELEAGEHKYYFEFDIPEDAPRSLPPLVISNINFAHLVWRLKAKIEMGSFLKFGNIVTHRGIWVENEVDIADMPHSLNPTTVEETIDTGVVQFWKTPGKITCTASIPKAVYIRGESVPLKLTINNQSKSEITRVLAYIRLHGKARLHDSKITFSNKISIKSEKVSAGPIADGECPTYNWNLVWDFSESSSDGGLLPVGMHSQSKLLDYKYEVTVKLKRKGLHRNMSLLIPICVGTCNSSPAEPADSTDQVPDAAEDSAQSQDPATLFPPMYEFA